VRPAGRGRARARPARTLAANVHTCCYNAQLAQSASQINLTRPWHKQITIRD
jgi:hypothetical protein